MLLKNDSLVLAQIRNVWGERKKGKRKNEKGKKGTA